MEVDEVLTVDDVVEEVENVIEVVDDSILDDTERVVILALTVA